MLKFNKIFAKMLVAFCISVIIAQPVFAITASDELMQLLNNLKTMQANFEQTSINSKGKSTGEKIIGSMSLERPGKFRWATIEPNKQLIIVNKDQSLLYDADLEQVIKRKMDYKKPGNPAMLLSSPTTTLKASFKIIKLKEPKSKKLFQLYPKNNENGYKWIKICFVKGVLQNIQIADNLEQINTINFINIVINQPISQKLFVFVPPKNTEIFDMRQAKSVKS